MHAAGEIKELGTDLLEELVGLVGLSHDKVLGDIDLETSVRGDGERLPRVERVLGGSVESSNRRHGGEGEEERKEWGVRDTRARPRR